MREASEEDIVMVLISGGGSALLPCPVEGVSLQEKAQVVAACMYNKCVIIKTFVLYCLYRLSNCFLMLELPSMN